MGSALPREERTICWKSVRSPALAEFIDAADTALAGFAAGRVLVSASTMVGEGGEACAPAGVCPSTGIWVGGEVCIPAAFGRSRARAPGEAVRAVTDSTTTAAKSFQKFRRFAFSFGRAFNLGLPKTQVGSCTKSLLDEANQQPRGISCLEQVEILRRSSRYYGQPGSPQPAGGERSARTERRLEPHRGRPDRKSTRLNS